MSTMWASPDDSTVGSLPSEDVVILAAGTIWRVSWELLVFGPFTSCVLRSGNEMRHVTTSSMLRSAVRRATAIDEPLWADDHAVLITWPPTTSLIEAARTILEGGCEVAVVTHSEPRLVSARAVIRALLKGHGSGSTAGSPVAAARPDSMSRDVHA